MDKNRRLVTYAIILAAFGFGLYFFVYPFIDQGQGQNSILNPIQNPESVPTLTNDLEDCTANPTSNCDQEILQIKDLCKENKDQNIPVCSDARIQQYIDNRGLERPTVNIGK